MAGCHKKSQNWNWKKNQPSYQFLYTCYKKIIENPCTEVKEFIQAEVANLLISQYISTLSPNMESLYITIKGHLYNGICKGRGLMIYHRFWESTGIGCDQHNTNIVVKVAKQSPAVFNYSSVWVLWPWMAWPCTLVHPSLLFKSWWAADLLNNGIPSTNT